VSSLYNEGKTKSKNIFERKPFLGKRKKLEIKEKQDSIN
jgi:hypothetical protein